MKCGPLEMVSGGPEIAGAISGLLLLSERVDAPDRTAQVDPLETRSIDRVLSGDSSAFSYLVSTYMKKVVAIAWGFVRDPAAAEDLAQEAFVRAYQNLHRFRRGDRFGPWIFRIVSNLALDQLKHSRRFPEELRRGSGVTRIEESALRVEMSEVASRIDAAIESLPPMQRYVARLYLVEELPHHDIAAALGLSVGTVRSHLSLARAKLKDMLRDFSPEGS